MLTENDLLKERLSDAKAMCAELDGARQALVAAEAAAAEGAAALQAQLEEVCAERDALAAEVRALVTCAPRFDQPAHPALISRCAEPACAACCSSQHTCNP